MKKIYSLAIMVMMAMCAMVVSSCGNDDDTKSEETDKDLILTTKANSELEVVGTLTADAQQKMKSEIVAAGAEFYGKIVTAANLGTYDSSTKQITIKSSNKDKVYDALNSADKADLKAALDKISGLLTVDICLYDQDENLIYNHMYKRLTDTAYTIGSWKWESADKDSTIVINITEKDESKGTKYVDHYKASVTITTSAGTNTYAGESDNTTVCSFSFRTDEKNADGQYYVVITGDFTPADVVTELIADVDLEGKETYNEITFKKQ